MTNWKRAVVFGSFGAGAFFLATGRRSAAAVLAGVALAALASEYPEHVERLWRNAPEYLNKGSQVMNVVSAFVDRLAESSALRRGSPYVV